MANSRRPAPGHRSMMPPTYAMVAVIIMVGLHYLAPAVRLADAPITWLGAPFIGVGVIFNVWAGRLFTKRRTTFKPFAPASLLIRDGPFRLSRNPMYLGIVLAALGIAMVMGTLTPFVVVAVLAWILQVRFIIVEEATLEATFGEDYRDYCRQVRRWV